jgi:hypothetical protein
LIFIILIIKKSKIEIQEQNNEFNKKFGTFFEEFKDTSTSERLFYLIFILRRLVIGACILFIDSLVWQLIMSIVFPLAVFIT